MTNLQTILVGSIPFVATAWTASCRRVAWTDRTGWIIAAAIAWAFVVGWVWHIHATPPALILAATSLVAGAAVGRLLLLVRTSIDRLPSRGRPFSHIQSARSSKGRSLTRQQFAQPRAHRTVLPSVRRSTRSRWPVVVLLASFSKSQGSAQTTVPEAEANSASTEEKSFLDRLSFVLDFDVVTAYYFRGIPQENQGFIGQPYATINFTAYESDDWLNNITLSLTTWNSIQTGPTGSGGDHRSPEAWYESDIVAAVSATMFEKWTAGVIYTAYTSPNDSYNTVQEIALKLAYDDTEALGAFALHPYALLAFELDDQADGGNSGFNPIAPTSEGIYLELGIAPGVPLIENDKWPVSLTIPVTLGIGLDDYYEDGLGGNTGAQFGFIDIGFDFSLPIQSIMPADAGAWTLKAGPHLIWLGNAPAELGQGITGGDHFDVWWKLSLSVTF